MELTRAAMDRGGLNMMIDQSPGEILLAELKKRGWTQLDLAFVIDCKPPEINDFVKGRRPITAATSKRFALALGLAPNYFLTAQRKIHAVHTPKNPAAGIIARARIMTNRKNGEIT